MTCDSPRSIANGAGPFSRLALAVCALALFTAAAAPADPPTYEWALGLGGTSGDEGRGVAVDAAGNSYVTGVFASTVDFGGGPLASTGSWDVYLVKYDAQGNHVWSRNFGGTSTDEANDIRIDGDGNVVITGKFWGTANFGGPASLTSNGAYDVFVAAYDSDGSHIWSRGFGSTGGDDGRGVIFDADGNVLVTGYVAGSTDFGGGNLTVSGAADAFLAKYGPTGAHLWSDTHGGTGAEIGNAVAADGDGNVLLAGQFNGIGNFGGANLVSAGNEDCFLAKYDANGAHQWSYRFGNVNHCIGWAVAADGAGNVVFTGQMTGNVDFGGGLLMGLLGTNVFLVKLDPAGAHLWSQTFGASQTSDVGRGLAVDAANYVCLTGHFDGTIDFGGGAVTTGGSRDVFIARFDPSGVHQWSDGFGTTMYQEGRAIAVDGSGNVVVTGIFANSIDFGGGHILSSGGNDVFLARFDAGVTTGVSAPAREVAGLATAAYPNPFRSQVTLDFTLPHPGDVSIDVFDARGARVASVLDARRSATRHRAAWNGRDDAGRRVAAGVYFVRYEFEGTTRTRRVVLRD